MCREGKSPVRARAFQSCTPPSVSGLAGVPLSGSLSRIAVLVMSDPQPRRSTRLGEKNIMDELAPNIDALDLASNRRAAEQVARPAQPADAALGTSLIQSRPPASSPLTRLPRRRRRRRTLAARVPQRRPTHAHPTQRHARVPTSRGLAICWSRDRYRYNPLRVYQRELSF